MNAEPSKTASEIFLVTLPGLEDIVQAEVHDWFPELPVKAEHGGVTVEASLSTGLAMNLALKTPTRILLRVASFRCRDFPKLFAKTQQLRWSEWVVPNCTMEVQASTRLSRLKIKKRIEAACLDGWSAYQKKRHARPSPDKKITLYVRLHNDDCTFSLDTSGERLHKRGQRTHVGEAPLRETIASALIQLMARHHQSAAAVELIDPMMGSGTFLLEGAIRDQLIDNRDFAFSAFAAKAACAPSLQVARPKIERFFGYEKDPKTMAAAKTNLKEHVRKDSLRLLQQDFFESEPLPATERRRWLICNPPYGERLKVNEPLNDFYSKLFKASERVVRPHLACFLLPSVAAKQRFELPPH